MDMFLRYKQYSLDCILYSNELPCGFDKSDKFNNKVLPLVNVGHFSTNLHGSVIFWMVQKCLIAVMTLQETLNLQPSNTT